ncbi:MAG: RHS repeat protein [Xanthomonadales bacterium]|nr:RHS repeat protein [Xanthomonadales bacterium]
MIFVLAWMLVLSPGSLLASWEVPAGQLAARTERFEVGVLCEAPNFAYDDQDDLVTHTDRRGIAHAYRYDHEHRATRYQRAGVTQWTREHDAVGNVLAETDANGHTTTSTYDAANQRISARAAGRRSWTYTPTNQVETQTDAAGAVTHNEYNERDQLLESTNGANETTTFTVDGDGLQRTRELAGAVWTNTFDAAHRLTGVESPEAHETIYGYNADDALTAITDAEGRVTTQAVDSQGRITSRSYPGGATFATTFDGNGNAVSDTTPEHSTTRSFDALNRLRSETAASITRTQSFDGNGNRLTASLGSDTVRTQTYDPHNRPLSDQLQTANSDYTLTATRDANGNRTLSRDARNVATTNTFDAHNRLIGSSAAEGATTNTWNADGTLARITQANGVETVYAYDGAKRITSITHRTNGIATLTFGYDYDGRGNRIEETRTEAALPGQAARTITTTHAYDRDDRLVRSTITHQPANAQTPDTRTEWTLDAVGNRQTETVTELATNTVRANKTYTYNERDQLERITDPANDLQIDYAYDDNGNREQRIVRQNGVITSQVDYTFDARDRLIQAQPNAPNEAIVQYQYDADDRRIARIETPRVNGIPQTPITTRSIYDGSNLLHEADPAQITATYRRSAVLDRHIDHATNTVRHYQLDALRTPVAMTDAAGNTINATTFDAWGNPTQQTAAGATTTPWSVPQYNPLTTGQAALLANDGQSIGFTGYGKDSTTGLYYANARWYDPLVGSFNAMDPAWGAATKPVTFHKYLYANGNPTVYVDRDGRCGVLGNVPMFSSACGIVDGAIIGVNPFSFEGEAAIADYRRGQGLGIAEDALGSAKGVIDLNIDFISLASKAPLATTSALVMSSAQRCKDPSTTSAICPSTLLVTSPRAMQSSARRLNRSSTSAQVARRRRTSLLVRLWRFRRRVD